MALNVYSLFERRGVRYMTYLEGPKGQTSLSCFNSSNVLLNIYLMSCLLILLTLEYFRVISLALKIAQWLGTLHDV